MITRQIITLPEYSGLINITRKAQVNYSINYSKLNELLLVIDIFHYDDSGKELTYLPKEVRLKASNQERVDANGDPVVKIEVGETMEWPLNSYNQYDYLYNIVNVQKAFTQEELEDLYVLKRLSKINENLYK